MIYIIFVYFINRILKIFKFLLKKDEYEIFILHNYLIFILIKYYPVIILKNVRISRVHLY
jgi:hypothetical protein